MEKAMNAASLLNQEILTSEIYKRYKLAKIELESKPEMKAKYDDFMKKHESYQLRIINNENPDFNEQRIMSSLYGEIMRTDEIKIYIDTKENLTSFIDEIMKAAFMGIDSEIL